MKNSTSHKVAQSIVLTLAIVWACMLFTSCSTSKGSTYQNHLRSKHSGGHHMSTNNKGCGWANN
jgi:hypothetical protein